MVAVTAIVSLVGFDSTVLVAKELGSLSLAPVEAKCLSALASRLRRSAVYEVSVVTTS